MRLHLFATGAVLLSTGCGALYEDVPVYGESDPNGYVQARAPQGSVEAIQQNANQATQAIDPGQEVNVGQPQDEYADTDPSALTDFKATLDPYGTWQDDGTYGTVWQPDANVVGSDFEPYVTGGHWSYDNDYTWVSDYDWGWAPFHYGRWVYIGGRGWCWVAGRTYAGAWVDWRVGGPGYGYVGWGPRAPSWYWRGGTAYGLGVNPHTPYTFCGTHDLFSPQLHDHVIRGGSEINVIGQNTHAWNDGRTPAHPGVGSPPLSHFGITPPPVPATHVPGLARALAFAHPSTAMQFGAHGPSYGAGAIHPTQVPYQARGTIGERPVATAPHYNGVAPQPYRSYPYAGRYSSPTYAPRTYASPQYHGGQSYSPPASYGHSYGGGGFGGGFGGGYHGVAPSSSPSYSHSYSHGGGGGGHSGGGHGGGGHGGGGHR